MSYNFNRSTLVGRLTRDPESRKVAETQKTSFTLAVDRPYRKNAKSGETDFVNIVSWGRLANVSTDLLRKGMPVLVDGKLQIRTYEKDNTKKYHTEILADTIQILERLPKKEETT